MDWFDFTIKFSSEILVIFAAFLVAGLNVYFFAGSGSKNLSDNSLVGKFLSYHPDQNRLLYTKNSSIVTTVSKTSGFFAQAQADELAGLSNQSINPEAPKEADMMLSEEENILVKPNPDSVQSLIDKQIKIYETQPGDTLGSIAAANGISKQTIIWANNLPSEQIKPGWQLIILPIDGVLVRADDNTTLPDIAKKYSADLDKIIAYNGRENAEDIAPGDLIIVPGGSIPTPPAPAKPKPTPTPAKPKVNNSGKVGGNALVQEVGPSEIYDDGTGHIFPKGYCTWYVAQKLGSKVKWGGNANRWIANSKAYGAVVDMDPAPGTILVTNENRKYGHVAYVEKVTDHSIIVSEMNYEKFGKVDFREIPLTSSVIKGFIHP